MAMELNRQKFLFEKSKARLDPATKLHIDGMLREKSILMRQAMTPNPITGRAPENSAELLKQAEEITGRVDDLLIDLGATVDPKTEVLSAVRRWEAVNGPASQKDINRISKLVRSKIPTGAK